MNKPVLFIDGEAGTTGLEIRKRLETRGDIELVSIAADKRKDAAERKRLLNSCDVAILCLPDDAAREALGMVDNPKVRVLDASTAYRTEEGWAYGFPELTPQQEDVIRAAKRVSNPGCYPTGALALLRPLTDAGILSRSHTVIINAVSGYSGGGKELIALCENPETKGQGRGTAFALYGLDQKHKHLPEMRVHSGLDQEPIFLPSYSNAFYRGMLVHIELRVKDLAKKVDGVALHKLYAERYAGKRYVMVEPLHEKLDSKFILSPEEQNGTNNVQLRVFWNAEKESAVLTACLDNLGKGACGAAVQNLEVMLGL
jgi:N-acetyl-gamma-glutamyl-phosphate reductase